MFHEILEIQHKLEGDEWIISSPENKNFFKALAIRKNTDQVLIKRTYWQCLIQYLILQPLDKNVNRQDLGNKFLEYFAIDKFNND